MDKEEGPKAPPSSPTKSGPGSPDSIEDVIIVDVDSLPGSPSSEVPERDPETEAETEDSLDSDDEVLNPSPHHYQLEDEKARQVFQDAIWAIRDLFKDKVVMEVGCGQSFGWLSFLAAKAGASMVYAIEKSELANEIDEIMKSKKNELEMEMEIDKIQVVHGEVNEIELPDNIKVDIIISQFWSDFMLVESDIEYLIQARDKFLKAGGLMLPNKASLVLYGMDCLSVKRGIFDHWRAVCGEYDMSVMKEMAFEKIAVVTNSDNRIEIATDEVPLVQLDLKTVKIGNMFPRLMVPFLLTAKEDVYVNGFGACMKLGFTEGGSNIELSTAPDEASTYKKVSVFFTKNEIIMNKDETMRGTFTFKKMSPLTPYKEFKIQFLFDGVKSEFNENNSYKYYY